MNTLNSKNDNLAASNTRGTDRFLLASVGTTPGASSMFLGEDRHRRRAARRALRSSTGRRRHQRAE
jgi:hypothetical protein